MLLIIKEKLNQLAQGPRSHNAKGNVKAKKIKEQTEEIKEKKIQTSKKSIK